MADDITGKRILIMASDGFEQSELVEPLEQLRKVGATVEVAALKGGQIKGWDKDDWGQSVPVDRTIAGSDAAGYDALVLPGGVINPDTLRQDKDALALIGAFAQAGKPIAAICHAPWLLAEAGLLEGKRVTSYALIRTDIANAGAEVVDESVVVDGQLITSRTPDDLPDFIDAIKTAVTA